MSLFSYVAFLVLSLSLKLATADEIIFSDNALSNTWQDWSWSSTISYSATDIAEGSTSVSVSSAAWSALSLYDTSVFGSNFQGLKFDVAGDNPDVSIYLTDTVSGANSPSIPLSGFGLNTTAGSFTSFLMNFNSLPPNGGNLGTGNWNRITFQAGGSGANYHIDNIELISEIIITPVFLSAEPLANNMVAVTTKGHVDFSAVQVTLNGKAISINTTASYTPSETPSISITYLNLNSPLAQGTLVFTTGDSTFTTLLPKPLNTKIDQTRTRAISPRIYGMNWPADASYIQELGITTSRWGGNAVTAYNPFGDFTNAGNDWFFENRMNDGGSADDWIGWVAGAGSDSMLTLPALDWVSKDATSYSYPKTLYPDQKAFDPYNGDAGDGVYADGSYAQPPPDPSTAYTPWNTSLAMTWLSGLKNRPTIIAIDNEIEIASNTHQDMHPQPMGFDEELERMIKFGTIAKTALPNTLLAGPSTCAWWYYWTSVIGLSDNAAHNNTDWLPWFLTQMQTRDAASGKRLLDFLDIHYYFAADTSANDDAAKALRLRMTRSWWDPTYIDESWIGTSTPQNTQPNATIVQLIPRMQSLIAQHYPGTKLSISEWWSTADSDITGGLVTADTLGIFGKYGVDSATYWSGASATSPVGLAYWLFRGAGKTFGNLSAQMTVSGFDPNVLGVYAATDGHSNPSFVIVNKDTKAVALNITGIASGKYFIRHFGGEAGVAKYQTVTTLKTTNYLAVPAYTAVFLQRM